MARTSIRDIVLLLATLTILLGGLWLYTGTWPPAVIVESGSMMHADDDVSFGRFGTIDPGDLVLVKQVDALDDITTLVEGGRDRYGKTGDVIVFYRQNDRADTPIIHRAVAYVEWDGSAYHVRWSDEAPCEGGATKTAREGRTWCSYGPQGILIPSIPVHAAGSTASSPRPYRPEASGFLTKGDNPATNRQIDQISLQRVNGPIPIEWVEGEARAELPWLGLIKLALAGKPNEDSPPATWTKIGWAYAPLDLWVMLGVTLFVLIGGPLILDAYRAYRARRDSGEG